MYYYGMSKEDIYNSSRKFIYSLYQQYVNRACENLGVNPNSDDSESGSNSELTDDDYPQEWITFSQKEREQYVNDSDMSDEDYLKRFDDMRIKARQPKK